MQKNPNSISQENSENVVVVPRDKSLKEDFGFEVESSKPLPEAASADGSSSSASGDGSFGGCS